MFSVRHNPNFGGLIFMFKFYPNLLSSILGGGYKMRRIYGWLETEKYINTWGNQLYTSLLTIGSSGLTGHGFREVLIRFPEPQTDFIFSVIGQNFGFLGTTSVVALLTAFDLKLISIASRHDQPRERYMVAGMIGMLLFQQLVNMGMITGLFPITGITLPFISYADSPDPPVKGNHAVVRSVHRSSQRAGAGRRNGKRNRSINQKDQKGAVTNQENKKKP